MNALMCALMRFASLVDQLPTPPPSHLDYVHAGLDLVTWRLKGCNMKISRIEMNESVNEWQKCIH